MLAYENRYILKRSETFIVQKSICITDITQHNIHDETSKYL